MPLGTLERAPPPFFRQGASALSRLILFAALALFLMVADTRFKLTSPVRMVIASVLYPVQWALTQPVIWTREGWTYVQSLASAQQEVQTKQAQMRVMAPRAMQYEQLIMENERLRKLLELRERSPAPTVAAQVMYDSADPYSHKLIIDKGVLHGIAEGAPVIDESGVLGQVTRVYPSMSEVTLVIDADQAIPVLNTRTGVRALAFGDPDLHGGLMELRYMAVNADVQPGDLLTTSGVDGVYPPGLPVARVERVERKVETPFAQIYCTPQAHVTGATQVMVLPARAETLPPRPLDSKATARELARRAKPVGGPRK